ncbi:hypothetical protein [Flavobacterium sp. Root186]|uniref:hypothetical protein n=1 Tax=Flavobacterium sp. Root186 TaxID=1736485 RepID=UPI0006F99DBD|nr:hypothetical protein [Flavobacterium sp. Root186]KRB57859.1 hypothetical protein ASD98_06195 [Flavobacterium sp. Root186]
MSNYTFEDYKKAIKAKYEEEIEGEHSYNLSSPTTANLRKLCVKRFKSNNNKDDLSAFESFFDVPFDKDKKNLFGDDEMNKLEAVKRFFLGRTENPAEDTIQLAAILVDLQPRPFNKFRKQNDPDDLELINDLRDTKFFSPQNSSDDLIDEVENENVIDPKIEEPKENQSQESEPIQDEESEPIFVAEKPESFQNQELAPTPAPISTFVNIDEGTPNNIWRYLGITAVVVGLGLIIYLALPKKDCMQWSGDHYDEVSCDLKIGGIGTFNSPEPYDERIIDLRRIKVCDTTIFFKNEKAVVWYAKVGDSVEFFNTHGMHPENGRALRPITHYIINKYVIKK